MKKYLEMVEKLDKIKEEYEITDKERKDILYATLLLTGGYTFPENSKERRDHFNFISQWGYGLNEWLLDKEKEILKRKKIKQ